MHNLPQTLYYSDSVSNLKAALKPTQQALTKPSWAEIWIKSFYRTRTCLDCCATFSTLSFVTPYSVILHGVVPRSHREPCFAVYYMTIST